ncbi:hypothetical protein MLD38_010833 [Melastoma candidum]|uniref:Uncharacterized protein n=1 Tax=Melastoma candidum TaxID=119954 RepID=A0ACB9R2Y5_9MYRT|nr:hypothetical protein MLD38_010833 [Melastoma candidum]
MHRGGDIGGLRLLPMLLMSTATLLPGCAALTGKTRKKRKGNNMKEMREADPAAAAEVAVSISLGSSSNIPPLLVPLISRGVLAVCGGMWWRR